jgi:hypothetical protein
MTRDTAKSATLTPGGLGFNWLGRDAGPVNSGGRLPNVSLCYWANVDPNGGRHKEKLAPSGGTENSASQTGRGVENSAWQQEENAKSRAGERGNRLRSDEMKRCGLAVVGALAGLSTVFASFVGSSNLLRMLGYYCQDIAAPRYLFPVLVGWSVTVLTMLFREPPPDLPEPVILPEELKIEN